MAKTDWALMTGSADGTSWSGVTILREATYGLTPPNGGGSAIFGINSIESVIGSVGVVTQVSGFAPLSSGGQITGAIQRGVSGGAKGFSNFLFICSTGSNVGDTAYLLGIEDASPGRIVLAKGTIGKGLPDNGLGTKILRKSSYTVNQGEWVHLRMDAIVQPTGDVVLRMYKNNLDTNPVGTPVWEVIEFEDEWNAQFADGYFIDDSVGVNSSSLPLTSGYAGFGFQCSESARRGYFDHIGITQQA